MLWGVKLTVISLRVKDILYSFTLGGFLLLLTFVLIHLWVALFHPLSPSWDSRTIMNLTESRILENSSNSALPLSLSSTSRMSRNVVSLLELQTGFLWFSFILLPVYDPNLTQFSFWNFWRSVAITSSFCPCLALNNQNVSSLTFVRLIFEALYEGVLLQKFEQMITKHQGHNLGWIPLSRWLKYFSPYLTHVTLLHGF